MAAGLSKKAPPRWLTKLGLDNFLDQDTYLLATQQHHILGSEARDLRKIMKERQEGKKKEANGSASSNAVPLERLTMPTRRKLFCLSSPTDAFGAKLEQFWDATLLRSPNRIANLMKLDTAGAFLDTPSREVVLDRKTQHLDICPDSQDVVRNCKKARKAGTIISAATLLAKVALSIIVKSDGGSSMMPIVKRLNAILKPSLVAWAVGFSSLISLLASKIHREYFFKYTEDYRRKDMTKIPKNIWLDAK